MCAGREGKGRRSQSPSVCFDCVLREAKSCAVHENQIEFRVSDQLRDADFKCADFLKLAFPPIDLFISNEHRIVEKRLSVSPVPFSDAYDKRDVTHAFHDCFKRFKLLGDQIVEAAADEGDPHSGTVQAAARTSLRSGTARPASAA